MGGGCGPRKEMYFVSSLLEKLCSNLVGERVHLQQLSIDSQLEMAYAVGGNGFPVQMEDAVADETVFLVRLHDDSNRFKMNVAEESLYSAAIRVDRCGNQGWVRSGMLISEVSKCVAADSDLKTRTTFEVGRGDGRFMRYSDSREASNQRNSCKVNGEPFVRTWTIMRLQWKTMSTR
jgi:hypothetical protein